MVGLSEVVGLRPHKNRPLPPNRPFAPRGQRGAGAFSAGGIATNRDRATGVTRGSLKVCGQGYRRRMLYTILIILAIIALALFIFARR